MDLWLVHLLIYRNVICRIDMKSNLCRPSAQIGLGTERMDLQSMSNETLMQLQEDLTTAYIDGIAAAIQASICIQQARYSIANLSTKWNIQFIPIGFMS